MSNNERSNIQRRQFLQQAGVAPAVPAAAMMQAAAPMGTKPAIKITDIKTFLVGAGSRNWLYIKILTDQGIHGIGEAYSCGPDEATVKVIEDFKLWLVGQDPRMRSGAAGLASGIAAIALAAVLKFRIKRRVTSPDRSAA